MSQSQMRTLMTFACLTVAIAATFTSKSAHALRVSNVIEDSKSGYIKVVVKPQHSQLLDILFVLDDSGSMQAHQAKLASQIPNLTSLLRKAGFAPTHAGVITTSMDTPYPYQTPGDGRLVGKQKKVAVSTDSDFETILLQNSKVGTSGNAYEKPFDAITKALSDEMLNTENQGFLRASAHLAVVLLTDAEDQSAVGPEATVQALTQLKGAGNFSLHGFIVPSSNNDGSCSRDDGRVPVRIETAIALAGGSAFDICKADYRQALEKLVEKVGRLEKQTIRLPSVPVFSSIEVSYGALKLPAGDIHRGWTFDLITNSVIVGDQFDWASQPPEAELEIKYVPQDWALN